MRRKISEITNVYGGYDRDLMGSYTSYHTVNIPRFKHKKKPISMIKALEVRDRIQRKKIIKRHINTNMFGMIVGK